MMSTPGIVALLTDFGLSDGYVGVMKGIILGIAPGTAIVDLTHDVPPQDLSTAAWILSTAWRAFPEATIFVAVVDPGVGTARRAVAFHAGKRSFVGPDNGVFTDILVASPAEQAVTLDNAAYFATPRPSATFHGRDIFAPCAAHLAACVPLAALGSALTPSDLVRLPMPMPMWEGERLVAHVRHIDHFGNAITDIDPLLTERILADPGSALLVGTRRIAKRAVTFGEGPAGEPFLLRDSSGHLAIAVRNGSAASTLGLAPGAVVEMREVSPLV